MSSNVSTANQPVSDSNKQLGSLLVEAEMLSADMMEIALQIASGFDESLVQVLVDTNKLTDADVQNALRAQSMINKGLVDSCVAIRALHFSHRTRLAFSDAINRVSAIFNTADEIAHAA